MRGILIISCLISVVLVAADVSGEQQRILRRVIKSTPTATNLGRVKLVTIRSVPNGSAELGAVSEISGKEAANFGQRSANETTPRQQPATLVSSSVKTRSPANNATKQTNPSTTTTTTTASSPSSTSTTSTPSSTTTSTTLAPSTEQSKPKVSERQQQANGAEVEVLAGAPSSWQSMMAVEAPVAALIAAGTRPAVVSSQKSVAADLSSSSSEESSDYLRASSSKTNYASQASVDETFSRLRQQQATKTTQQQQQSFFYPQQQQLKAPTKTSNYQAATKTHWYQPSSTTPRPAPIVQQQYEQQYEQQVEQLVEGPAPPGQAEPFAFDFRTQDNSGNGQYRKEESDNNGVVRGSYGYTDANGIYRHVEYVADHNGFRAKINSNEPGLIGETQPASIKLDGGPAPSSASQRFSASPNNYNNVNNNEGSEWSAASSSSNERANLALAPPDFESAHKPELLRAPRHFRN